MKLSGSIDLQYILRVIVNLKDILILISNKSNF